MKKHIISALLALLVLQVFTGCKKDNTNDATTVEATVEMITEVTTTPSYPGTIYTPESNDGDLDDGFGEQQDNNMPSAQEKNDNVEIKTSEAKTTEIVPAGTKPIETKPVETEVIKTEPIKTESTETPDLGSQTAKPATGDTDYEAYIAMSGPEQQKFMESFDSIQAFFEWHIAAKAAYEAAHPPVYIVGDGINAEDLVD